MEELKEDDFNEEIVNLKDCNCYPLRDHECFFNWVDAKFDENLAKDRFEKRQCVENCSDMKEECGYCRFDGEWRSHVKPTMFLDCETDELNCAKGYMHKFISWNGEMSFLETFGGNYEKAESRLNYIDSVIDVSRNDGHSDLELLDGYQYVSKTLRAYNQFRKDSLEKTDIESLENFTDLSIAAKIGVLSVKYRFYKEIKCSFKIQTELLKKLIELDPANPVWYESLGLRLRLLKKERTKYGYGIKEPGFFESKAFATAYNLRPDVPQFFVSFARNIAEVIKSKQYRSRDQPFEVDVEGESIETVGDVLDFLKKYARFLLDAVTTIESDEDGGKVYATMVEVFSVSLPSHFQDHDLAEEFATIAVQLSPDCSKPNHRMGIFQWMKRGNYEKALEYLTVAVGVKNDNFYALIDWIQLLMHKAVESADILKEIFAGIFTANFSWASDEAARLIFLKGCFLFMIKGKRTEIIDLWCQAYKTDGSARHFRMTFIDSRRFSWRGFERKKLLNILPKHITSNIFKKMVAEIKNENMPKLKWQCKESKANEGKSIEEQSTEKESIEKQATEEGSTRKLSMADEAIKKLSKSEESIIKLSLADESLDESIIKLSMSDESIEELQITEE